MASSVCINHTDRAATSRCSCCHKPICNECVLKSGGSVFCSQACIEGAARFNKNFKPERGPGFFASIKNMIVSLIGLAILLAIGIGVAAYVFKVQFAIDLLKKVGL
ncbi:MAG TPA: hypothetical protein VEJ63_11410 [Planctomycetota bacterium]|nr:hypothetical protein [Planctomycetota bacterium]